MARRWGEIVIDVLSLVRGSHKPHDRCLWITGTKEGVVCCSLGALFEKILCVAVRGENTDLMDDTPQSLAPTTQEAVLIDSGNSSVKL